MKLVHIVDYLMPEIGYQEFLLPLENSREGIETHIITSDRYYPIKDYDQKWGTILGKRLVGRSNSKVEKLEIHRLSTFFEVLARPWIIGLNKHINGLDPDIIFIHGSGSFLIYRIVLRNYFNRRLIYVDNHMIEDIVQTGFFQKIYYLFHKLFMKTFIERRVTRFFGVTKDSCNYLKKYEGINSKKINLLSLGVDTNTFYPLKFKEFSMNPFIIIQTGKLDDFKSPDLLARAASHCLRNNLNIHVKFIGSGPKKMHDKLHAIFCKYGFENNYEICGFKTAQELAREFSEAHLSVYPGGTSLSAIESAAVGCPVLMNDLPASLEKNGNGIGFTFKNNSLEDLTNKIEQSYYDRSYLNNISKKGLKAVSENYSYKKISSDLIRYINEDRS